MKKFIRDFLFLFKNNVVRTAEFPKTITKNNTHNTVNCSVCKERFQKEETILVNNTKEYSILFFSSATKIQSYKNVCRYINSSSSLTFVSLCVLFDIWVYNSYLLADYIILTHSK